MATDDLAISELPSEARHAHEVRSVREGMVLRPAGALARGTRSMRQRGRSSTHFSGRVATEALCEVEGAAVLSCGALLHLSILAELAERDEACSLRCRHIIQAVCILRLKSGGTHTAHSCDQTISSCAAARLDKHRARMHRAQSDAWTRSPSIGAYNYRPWQEFNRAIARRVEIDHAQIVHAGLCSIFHTIYDRPGRRLGAAKSSSICHRARGNYHAFVIWVIAMDPVAARSCGQVPQARPDLD